MIQNKIMKANRSVFSFSVLILLFFMWGFATSLNDILIPHLKALFDLTYFQAMLVQFAFFGAYFIGSLGYFLYSVFYEDPINKIGYKNGIIAGLAVSALGCILFYPSEVMGQYWLFLISLFILGIGFTFLQISANPYVIILGDPKDASSRLNLAQGFNSLGTTIGPVLGGFLIFEFFASQGDLSPEATKIPYLVLGLVFLALSIIFKFIHLPEVTGETHSSTKMGALSFPQLRGGIAGIFFYVGAEVTIGSLIISFLGSDNVLGLSESIAKNYLALYWGGAMIGRFLGSFSLNNKLSYEKKLIYMAATALAVFFIIYLIVGLTFSQMSTFLIFIGLNYLAFLIGKSMASRTLLLFALINILLLIITIFGEGPIRMWALLAIGLFNSIMWSNIFSLSISGLGEYTSQGSSLLIMGILGGALIPLFQGFMADIIGLENSFLIPIVSYLYIAGYGYYCWRKFKI